MLFTVRDITISEYYGPCPMARSVTEARRPILRRRGKASAAKRAANRRNARRSTGPRTAAGKARAARNARRHGLTGRPIVDLAFVRAAADLAGAILSARTDPAIRLRATQIAIAHIRVLQVRKAKRALHASGLEWYELTRRLASLDRYEGRALARRKMAMRRFDAEPAGEISQARQNEPTAENNSAISIDWLRNRGRRRRFGRRTALRRWLRRAPRRPHNGFSAKSPRWRRRQWPPATAGAPRHESHKRFRAPRAGRRR